MRRARGAWIGWTLDPAELVNRISNYQAEAETGIGEVESIVLPIGRPVLLVQREAFDSASLAAEPASKVWKDRLETAREPIETVIPSVGRINLRDHPTFDWVGTGWLVREDVVVTNRHVAELFAFKADDGSFAFRENFEGRPISATIDFAREFKTPLQKEFPITEVIHIEPPNAPDVALLRVSREALPVAKKPDKPIVLGRPIPLSITEPAADRHLAVIGYPARDSRIPDPLLMRTIFGDIYDVKRLAPGTVMKIVNGVMMHDASTLGGNSGSLVLDLKTGEAVGLHSSGSFKVGNFAVLSTTVRALLEKLSLR